MAVKAETSSASTIWLAIAVCNFGIGVAWNIGATFPLNFIGLAICLLSAWLAVSIAKRTWFHGDASMSVL